MMSDELKQEEKIIRNEILKKGREKNLTERELMWDGVVSEEKYLDKNNKYKIMWMLMEGHNEGSDKGIGFKLGTDLLDPEKRNEKAAQAVAGGMLPVLRGMINVTYCLLNDKSFEDGYETDPEKIEVLTRIAWVNINKVTGKLQTDKNHLKNEYNFWKEILFKQIKIYSPDILLFGGTFSFFREDWEKEFGCLPKGKKINGDDGFFSHYFVQNKMWIVYTCHPTYAFKKNEATITKRESYVNVIIKTVNTISGKK